MEWSRRARAHRRRAGSLCHREDRRGGAPRPLRRRSTGAAALTRSRRKVLVVCGPTASGKSYLADVIADALSEVAGGWATTILVDSMQVYREIPVITNQARARPAELAGVVSVSEEWTVARHRERAQGIICSLPPSLPVVLDAGTGMYLNAVLLDIPLAPKAPPEVRAQAARHAARAENPRREARRLELDISGAPERGSIWGGDLRYDTAFVYLRPPRHALDNNIRVRSASIVSDGVQEARRLMGSRVVPNPSVREAIGVKEMLLHVSGSLTADETRENISTRTRRLARRQIRWFDKLTSVLLQSRRIEPARVLVLDHADEKKKCLHLMHDIIRG